MGPKKNFTEMAGLSFLDELSLLHTALISQHHPCLSKFHCRPRNSVHLWAPGIPHWGWGSWVTATLGNFRLSSGYVPFILQCCWFTKLFFVFFLWTLKKTLPGSRWKFVSKGHLIISQAPQEGCRDSTLTSDLQLRSRSHSISRLIIQIL